MAFGLDPTHAAIYVNHIDRCACMYKMFGYCNILIVFISMVEPV